MQGTDGAPVDRAMIFLGKWFQGLSSVYPSHSQMHLQIDEAQFVGSQVWISQNSKIKTKIVRRINIRFSAFSFSDQITPIYYPLFQCERMFNVCPFPTECTLGIVNNPFIWNELSHIKKLNKLSLIFCLYYHRSWILSYGSAQALALMGLL